MPKYYFRQLKAAIMRLKTNLNNWSIHTSKVDIKQNGNLLEIC